MSRVGDVSAWRTARQERLLHGPPPSLGCRAFLALFFTPQMTSVLRNGEALELRYNGGHGDSCSIAHISAVCKERWALECTERFEELPDDKGYTRVVRMEAQ